MKRKYIGSTGDILVFGNLDEVVVHYACTTQSHGTCWARIYNQIVYPIRTEKLPSVEISEEEYISHVWFCLKITEAQVKGSPLPMLRQLNSGQYFDYNDYLTP
ncbi:hypothetical protein GCM10027442_22000 [Emticicia fontis]